MNAFESERMNFRRLKEEDLDDLAALYCDQEVMRYYPRTRTKEETRESIKLLQRRYETEGVSLMAAIRKSDQKMIGRCGIILQDIEHEIFPEVGYMFNKSVWQNGFGAEAAAAFRDYGFENMSYPEMICIIHPLNVPSQKVANKIGMTLQRFAIYDNVECQIYSITRNKWLSLTANRN